MIYLFSHFLYWEAESVLFVVYSSAEYQKFQQQMDYLIVTEKMQS